MNQEQFNTNAEQYFTQSEAQTFYPKCGTKTNPRADPQNSDYSNDKNVIFASSCPSLETQLDDIATYQNEFIIFGIARSAQGLSARGIVPDIIFAADIQDLNIAFFDGLKADFIAAY